MKASNSLTGHFGESFTSRSDKMSGTINDLRKGLDKMRKEFGMHKVRSMAFAKKFYSRKRRMFMKNKNNWEKI